MGKATIQQLRDQMEMILSDHAAATQGKEAESYSIDLKLADHQLHGLIRNIFGGDLVEVCVSSDHFKYLLAGYVRYLALCASGHSGDFIFIAKAFPGLHRIPAGKFTPEMALEMLSDYVKYYVKGHKDYFKFYPNIARDNFKMIDKGYAEFSDALEKLIDDEKNFEFKDEYLLKAIDHGIFSEGHFDDLQMNVRKIMGPLKEALPVFFSTPKSQKKRKKEN
jgi:exonuclease V gamma subunit